MKNISYTVNMTGKSRLRVIMTLTALFFLAVAGLFFSRSLKTPKRNITRAAPVENDKPITGTFLMFDVNYPGNQSERENLVRQMLQEMSDTGIDTVVILAAGNIEKTGATYSETAYLDTPGNPYREIMKIANELNLKIYMGLTAWNQATIHHWVGEAGNPDTDKGRIIDYSLRLIDKTKQAMTEIGVPWTTVSGFYIGLEVGPANLTEADSNEIMFYKELSQAVKNKEPGKKIIISPYIFEDTTYAQAYSQYANLFTNTAVDIVALQDSMGSGKVVSAQKDMDHFRALKDVVDKFPGREAWANIESFHSVIDNGSYDPTTVARLQLQIASAKPYVSKMITWIYQHTMLTVPFFNNAYSYTGQYTAQHATDRTKLRTDYMQAYGIAVNTPAPTSPENSPDPFPSADQSPSQSAGNPSLQGGTGLAQCDLCGYCPPNPPPQSWSACQKCLYPDIKPDPASNESLRIDPVTNQPAAAVRGRQFTFLGCVDTTPGVFTQSLLKIIFSLVGGIAFLYLLYGSFIIATSQNEPEKINYGKRVIYGSIAGLIFSLMSVSIVNTIAAQILKVPGFK